MAKKSSAALERRRITLRNRQQAAEKATVKSRSLDARLEAIAAVRAEYASRLRAAQEEVTAMKKAIKASAKQRDELSSRRKNARRDEVTAHQRIASAETKYERAVLADLVQREKIRDLATHTTTPAVVPPPAPLADPVTQLAASSQHDNVGETSTVATDPDATNTTPPTSRSTTTTAGQNRAPRSRNTRSSSRLVSQSEDSAS